MIDKTLDNMLGAIQHYVGKRYISAETCLSVAQDTVNRLAYNYRMSEPEKRGLCPKCGKKLYKFHENMNPMCSDCNYIVPDGDNLIYLGLYGVYPPERNDEDDLPRASEGTKKISDLMDKFIIDLLTLQGEYSDEGATDTSAREHIFEKLDNRYYNARMNGF